MMERVSVREEEEEVKIVESPVKAAAATVAPGRGVGRRRRLLNANVNSGNTAIYTGRVNRTLHLYPSDLDRKLWKQSNDSDSEDEGEKAGSRRKRRRLSPEQTGVSLLTSDSETELDNSCAVVSSPGDHSLSPPSSPAPPGRHTGRARNAIREANKRLGELDEFRSFPLSSWGSEEVVWVGTDSTPNPHSPREVTLKLRCRGEVHRMPLRVTSPLQTVVDQLGEKINIDPSRIVLLRNDSEISLQDTPESGNIGVADILDCLITPDASVEDLKDDIRLKVRGMAKYSVQIITIGKDEPMKRLMDDYRDRFGLRSRAVRFVFDGETLPESATAEQLGIETDDVIDVLDA